ncbi:GNAT family N-acetyltransferase [Pseudooctadecabacter jejudonensis]|uniref:N-acetylglutamate synthase n=1 Tax=Pseudooctadecabacter jejudonensis TaxID=1391910 RepID=A0A1Y5RQ96_9RHOB|nr:GNAT family N-acetyltransferase [Pseudooctadecabacter jejudonensis]SLN22866.1 N-acetylglutamate synthase [Pseudooctadecabacter jejudonensis]
MFTIRPTTSKDIGQVDTLLARSYPRLLKGDYPASILVMALPLISRAQPDLITSGTYYGVEHAGRLLGAGGWTVAAPGGGAVTRGVGHIRHVATDPDTTRQGVGRALMDHILATAQAQGLRRMMCLSTRTAEPFYTAMGFETGTKVTVPLGPGIDFPAVEMSRAL